MKKILTWFTIWFNRFYNYRMIKCNPVIYETFPRINGRLKIINSSRNGRIIFKTNCLMNAGLMQNPVGGVCESVLYLLGDSAQIIFGSYSGFSNAIIVAKERIEIGEHVFIGAGCKIYDTDFHSIYHEERIAEGNKGVKTRPVVIEDGVFIGACSMILKGVSIGRKSVIGAGSVVSKSVPAGEIWAGNPARFIRKIYDENEMPLRKE